MIPAQGLPSGLVANTARQFPTLAGLNCATAVLGAKYEVGGKQNYWLPAPVDAVLVAAVRGGWLPGVAGAGQDVGSELGVVLLHGTGGSAWVPS